MRSSHAAGGSPSCSGSPSCCCLWAWPGAAHQPDAGAGQIPAAAPRRPGGPGLDRAARGGHGPADRGRAGRGGTARSDRHRGATATGRQNLAEIASAVPTLPGELAAAGDRVTDELEGYGLARSPCCSSSSSDSALRSSTCSLEPRRPRRTRGAATSPADVPARLRAIGTRFLLDLARVLSSPSAASAASCCSWPPHPPPGGRLPRGRAGPARRPRGLPLPVRAGAPRACAWCRWATPRPRSGRAGPPCSWPGSRSAG